MNRSLWTALLGLPALTSAAAPAQAVDYLDLDQAQRAVVPGASSFAAFAVTLTPDQLKQIKAIAHVPQRATKPRVWKAMAGGRQTGWVIVDEVIGKHEMITYATGIAMDGHVLGVEIMSYRESKGDQVRNPKWRGLFRGKTVRDAFKLNQDIPNISGATLSCRNLTDGVKRLLALHQVALAKA
ncbi:FMN-binding protein [Novosphingobium sp. 1949]|uniref:FMN-binding protein n=1 Tax=Novosphingobium organovorum TaxID=2930092 RepID=A0ABT0B9Q5_9SPHN|nr:FMN-binding protein [Novosphingobium organovorum]MCJ2181593.1 FMN-binding protein [Novosphingobium organovorum]